MGLDVYSLHTGPLSRRQATDPDTSKMVGAPPEFRVSAGKFASFLNLNIQNSKSKFCFSRRNINLLARVCTLLRQYMIKLSVKTAANDNEVLFGEVSGNL